jgi:hypothetical protein
MFTYTSFLCLLFIILSTLFFLENNKSHTIFRFSKKQFKKFILVVIVCSILGFFSTYPYKEQTKYYFTNYVYDANTGILISEKNDSFYITNTHVKFIVLKKEPMQFAVLELKNIYKKNPEKVASNLVIYLVGNKDFYKVIKGKNSVEINAYNLNGTLNLPFKGIQPKYKTPKVPLPTKIIDIDFKMDSDTTAVVTMNNDWTLSFRIHNASSRIESSLKFDINLLKCPSKLFKNTLNLGGD